MVSELDEQRSEDELRPVVVTELTNPAMGVRGVCLADAGGRELPRWQPGAHVDLVLPSGIVRPYSLCGDPGDLSTYRIAVLRETDSRGGSVEVHDDIHVGDQLDMRGPRNRFPLVPASGYLFVAGGIGITPLLPMISQVESQGIPWHLVYGGRSRNSMAFLDMLTTASSSISVLPDNEFGLLDVPHLVQPDSDVSVYCCGPQPLIDAVQEHCDHLGVADRLHFERFTGTGVGSQEDDQGFDVRLGDAGPVYHVPAGQSILSVLLDADIQVPFSCEEGTCGSCETRVLSGEVDHRDDLLTPQERAAGSILICTSRAQSQELVLQV